MHWYVYHSQKTMKRSYASLGEPVVYSTKAQPKLCGGDVVWVVEGDMSNPVRFELADCFRVSAAECGPFTGDLANFKARAIGAASLLPGTVSLTDIQPWFADLHQRYITKQKLFCALDKEATIVAGLVAASSIKLEPA